MSEILRVPLDARPPVTEEIATEVGSSTTAVWSQQAPSDLIDRMETSSKSALEDIFLEVTIEGAYAADDSTSE